MKSGERRRIPRWPFVLAGAMVVLLAGAVAGAIRARPWLRARAIDLLRSHFHGEVEIRDFHVRLFPTISVTGFGIVLRHHGRRDVPPLLQIGEFSASASLAGLFEHPLHLHQLRLRGLVIQFPPKEKRQGLGSFTSHDVPVLIDEMVTEDAELDVLPGTPGKPAHQFLISQLVMYALGQGRPAAFVATLSNPAPPGEIHARGEFGPWQPDDPRATPVSAQYTFEHADLSVFKGIAGILSSQGQFGGPLDNLQVEGETTTPDFAVASGRHPMMLKTEFQATVDGSNGNTLLHPVVAHLGESTLVCNGSIVKAASGKGREVVLDVLARNARVQDLLHLAVPTKKPPFTGTMNLRTKFDLPPPEEGGEVADRLRLDGQFGIGAVAFTNPEVRNKVATLSARAQGHAKDHPEKDKPEKDQPEDDPLSQLRGKFKLRGGVITMSDLGFSVPGADVELTGTYGLHSEELDFHGKARLQAKPSQMVTGVKSVLLKPLDPFFRKNGMTEVPIKVTGTRDQPSFGLDFHHKKDAGDRNAKDLRKEDEAKQAGKKEHSGGK